MKGLELSRRYYETVGKPALEKLFANWLPRLAVGLVGEGSECFGYDDELSRDHDFGAGFCIWLNREDYAAIGPELQRIYDGLPREFLGFPARNETEQAGKRVGVMEITSFYSRFVGRYQPPKTMLEWLYLPENNLATVTNGAVFADPLGEFSGIRKQLAQYYPEDVRIKKIAARCAVMAQAGQYNYGRCMRRKDAAAAQLALHEFMKAALSLVYLMNRIYAPYYKWQFYRLNLAMRERTDNFVLPEVVRQLERLVLTSQQLPAWNHRQQTECNQDINFLDERVSIIENICTSVAVELQKQGLSWQSSPFLQAHLPDIMSHIRNPELRARHLLDG